MGKTGRTKKKVAEEHVQRRVSLRVAGRSSPELADILYTVERHEGSPLDLFEGHVWRDAVKSLPSERRNGLSVFERAELLLYQHRSNKEYRELVVDALNKKGSYSAETILEYVERRRIFDEVEVYEARQRGQPRSEDKKRKQSYETLRKVQRIENKRVAEIQAANSAEAIANSRRMRQQNKAQTATRAGQKRKILGGGRKMRKKEKSAVVPSTGEASWENEVSNHDIGFIEDPATPLNLKVEEESIEGAEDDANAPSTESGAEDVARGNHFNPQPVKLLRRLVGTLNAESDGCAEENAFTREESGSEDTRPADDSDFETQAFYWMKRIAKTTERQLQEGKKTSAAVEKIFNHLASLSNVSQIGVK